METPVTRSTWTLLLAVLLTGALFAGCAPADEASTEETDAAADATAEDGEEAAAVAGDCSPESLDTLEAGTLTIATGEPAYEPWIVDDTPENGEGFEGAVAYAVAEELGYSHDQVNWVRADFNAAIQPGPKPFDFDINQFSITEERREAVDFSSSYYDVTQALITIEGSPIAEAASLPDLQQAQLGAQVGTTSLQAIEEVVQPEVEPSVYNTNDEAKLALENGQIDGLVVDLPTAFFITAAELDNGVIVGQLPESGGETEQFGLVLDKDSPLTDCVSQAVDALREDGTLATIETEWLADVADAPVLE